MLIYEYISDKSSNLTWQLVQLYVNIYTDKDWIDFFGKFGSKREVKRIMEHTKELWQHPSLKTKIDILTNPDRFYNSDVHLTARKQDYNKILPGVLNGPDTFDGQPTAHIYLTVEERSRRLYLYIL